MKIADPSPLEHYVIYGRSPSEYFKWSLDEIHQNESWNFVECLFKKFPRYDFLIAICGLIWGILKNCGMGLSWRELEVCEETWLLWESELDWKIWMAQVRNLARKWICCVFLFFLFFNDDLLELTKQRKKTQVWIPFQLYFGKRVYLLRTELHKIRIRRRETKCSFLRGRPEIV